MNLPSAARGPQARSPGTESAPPATAAPQVEALPPLSAVPAQNLTGPGKINVALLLPLSGPSGTLGQAMLNAAQMALYDLGDDRLELLTRDTQGNPRGAAAAAQAVIASGAQLILGPLLAGEVEAVKPIANSANVPVIAFSTATQLAGDGVYLMGFTPNQEIQRITAYAHAHGHDRFAVFAPRVPYGQVVADAVRTAVSAAGASLVRVEFYDPSLRDIAGAVRSFAAEGHDYDALFLPEGDGRLKSLAPQLPLQRFDCDLRDPQRPAGPDGLGVTVRADRPPHRDRPGVQIHVVPGQHPRFLGPDAGQQAQHDVRVQPRVFRRLQQRRCLLYRQGL